MRLKDKRQNYEKNQKTEHDDKVCHRRELPSSNDGKIYWKGVVLPSALYGAEVIDMKGEETDNLQKAENTAKWAAQAAIRLGER